MNHFIEYICRSAVRSEDAICRLNKRIAKLTKRMNHTSISVICIGVGAVMVASVVAMQDREIKILQNKVAKLEEACTPLINVTDNTEENTQQEGA